MPLVIVDSVWSIGGRHEGVLNVIARLRALFATQGLDADATSTSAFVDLIDLAGGSEKFADQVSNRQRTSSRSGILKAEAVYREARMLAAASIESPDDVRGASESERVVLEHRWCTEVPGQASGLSWDYFVMLLEMPGVKAERMLCRFVAAALGLPPGASISPPEAARLVHAAAAEMGVNARDLDYNIWNYQRAQG